jgi:hypothetical protein
MWIQRRGSKRLPWYRMLGMLKRAEIICWNRRALYWELQFRMRVSRWKRSSSDRELRVSRTGADDSKRQTTLVTELILQASSASYMMQHFAIYRKWSTRLLSEVCAPFKKDRNARDPLESWYERELQFFETVSFHWHRSSRSAEHLVHLSDGLLDYAQDNRTAWATAGRDIVKEAAVQVADSSGRYPATETSPDPG